jgi:hypothetical protein
MWRAATGSIRVDQKQEPFVAGADPENEMLSLRPRLPSDRGDAHTQARAATGLS